jgi:hypothetical protein
MTTARTSAGGKLGERQRQLSIPRRRQYRDSVKKRRGKE